MKGKFIVFEGGEFCGKSTLSKMVYNELKRIGCDVVLTREPGGTKVGEEIRNILKTNELHAYTKLYLNLAARTEHINNIIKPALEDGKIVICDRYFLSTYVYQSNEGISKDVIAQYVPFVKPDLTIVLDVDPEIAINRSKNREYLDINDKKDIEFHDSIRKKYLELKNKHNLLQFVDSNKPIDEVFFDTMNLLYDNNIIDTNIILNNYIYSINDCIINTALSGEYKYNCKLTNKSVMDNITCAYIKLGFSVIGYTADDINYADLTISWNNPKKSDYLGFSAIDIKRFTDKHNK